MVRKDDVDDEYDRDNEDDGDGVDEGEGEDKVAFTSMIEEDNIEYQTR
jgi:hypothetical protein